MQVWDMVYKSEEKVKEHLGFENEEARPPSLHPNSPASHTCPQLLCSYAGIIFCCLFGSICFPISPLFIAEERTRTSSPLRTHWHTAKEVLKSAAQTRSPHIVVILAPLWIMAIIILLLLLPVSIVPIPIAAILALAIVSLAATLLVVVRLMVLIDVFVL